MRTDPGRVGSGKAAAAAKKTRVLTQDEINIKAYAEKNKNMVDEQGRRMF